MDYNAFKEMFGGNSSWAVWAKPEKGNWSSKDSIADLDCVWCGGDEYKSIDDYAKERFNNIKDVKYVFVGLNPSDHNCDNCSYTHIDKCEDNNRKQKAKEKGKELWSNFHSACTIKSQDYKLRKALYDTDYWGSFITDIKPDVETDSNKISTTPTEESIKMVNSIISLFGEKITFIAIGSKSCTILQKILPENVNLKKITHYSYRSLSPDNYVTRVKNDLNNIITKRITRGYEKLEKSVAKLIEKYEDVE